MRECPNCCPCCKHAYDADQEIATLRALVARVDSVLEDEFGGFWISQPHDSPAQQFRQELLSFKRENQ